MATMRRILITGKDGQLGSELCAALAPLGEITAADRTRLDLTDAAQIRRVIAEIRPSLIVNAAAYTAVDRAEAEPELAAAINSVAPGVLAEAAKQQGAAILHFSTDYVFDGSARTPYPPDAPTSPINVYGTTKRDGERAVIDSGAAHVIVRTSWVYAMTGRNFVRAILSQAEQGKPLRVVNDQTGSPTWARDLAVGTATIARQLLADPSANNGIYHLAGDGVTTWYDFACAIVEEAGLRHASTITPVPSSEFPTKARRPMYSALDCSRAVRDFGVKLPHWRDAIKRALQSRVG
jgi:dTDP-4-dehydrorhamnose reductase